jgi:tetratricopeptide (TPR) repeat protein
LTAIGLLVLSTGGARADMDACFGDRSERRIEACSDVIDMPDLDTTRRSLAYAMRALAYSLRTEYETAIRDYDEALRLNPSFPVALNNRAWAYFKMGKPLAGLPDAEKALGLDPGSAHAYDTRAHILQWMKRSDDALADYDRAMYFGGERMIRLYQCGLQNNGLYTGRIDGLPSPELRRAMSMCVTTTDCDPLPPDEECRAATS